MILLDSSFLIAHQNELDVHHKRAVQTMDRVRAGEFGPPVLLEYVLLEVATVLLARRGLESAVALGDRLLHAEEIEFVPCSPYMTQIWDTFRSQPGRLLSFVDSALVTIARRRAIQTIASFDSDFRKAGLTVVPA